MKAWTIAWKDTLIRLRDRNALILNLLAPLFLAGIMGAAFGGQGDGSSPITDIPIIIVNDDTGEFGNTIIDIFTTAAGLADLLEPTEMNTVAEAIEAVQQGEARAVIYFPVGFSTAIQPEAGNLELGDPATVQLFTDPASTLSPIIVRGVLEQLLSNFNKNTLSAQVAVDQLTSDHIADLGPKLAQLGTVIPAVLGEDNTSNATTTIHINQIVDTDENEEPLNLLLFFTPAMAIFFLMFSMMEGSRTILDEKLAGTLDRLLATPTSAMQIVLGKIGGTFLIGILQMTVLILASSLIFGISWGNVFGVTLVTIGVVAAATSLGTLIAAFATQPNQVQLIGTAIAIMFSMLGGNFIPAEQFPNWMQPISKLTLSRWAMDGFRDLTIERVGFAGILPEAGVLFGMSILFFGLGVWQFQRRLKG